MRYRFIDRILKIDAHGAGAITTLKAFARSAEYFDETFRPGGDVPASLILEAMTAAGSWLLTVRSGYRAHALLLKVNRAGFRRAVQTGDCLIVRSRIAGMQGDWSMPDNRTETPAVAETHAQGFVGPDAVAQATLFFVGVPLARTLGCRWKEILRGARELIGDVDGSV